MLLFDLRWVLFGLLTLLSTVVIITVYATRWQLGRRQSATFLRQLRPLFEDAPLGILILTGAQHYAYANPQARRLFDLSSETGKLPTAIWVLDLQADLQQLAQAPQGRYRTIRLASTMHEQKEQETSLTVRWWVIAWAGVNLLFVVDLTQQQRTAQQSRFLLSDLSHELRTPLATLQTHIEVLRLPTLSAEIHNQSLHILKEETQRLVRLVNSTLELGRLETGLEREQSALDLRLLVEECMTQLLPTAQAVGARLTLVAATPLPPVFGQPERLKQVFINLLDNALQYGGERNAITVTLQNGLAGVLCQVTDTGPGVAPEHLPKLGRRFYRAAPSAIPGNGLGLALVTEILRQHQSQLKIKSTVADPNTMTMSTGTSVSFLLSNKPREELL